MRAARDQPAVDAMEALQILLFDRLLRNKRICGRVTASASLASFVWDVTYGFTNYNAIRQTLCHEPPRTRAQ